MTGYTHKLGKTYTSDMGTIATTSQTFTGNSQLGVDEDVPGSTTNQLIPVLITVAKIKSMTIYSSAAQVTIKTNSSGSPQETIIVPGGAQLEWDTTAATTIPFGGNITALYVSNATATLTRFRMEVLLVD